METSQFVCIIGATIAVYIMTFGMSFLFLRKKLIYFKAMLFGALIYFVSRGFLMPMLSIMLQPILKDQMKYISVLLVILFAVFMKIFLYPFFFKKNPTMKSYISAGFGEGLTEAILSIFPVFTNALAYCMKIQDGSIYTFFSKVYNETEIQSIVDAFVSTPNSYYIYMALSVVFLIVINVLLAYLIYKKEPVWRIIAIASVLFIINIIIPYYSYIGYIGIVVIACIALYVKSGKLNCLLVNT